MQIIGIISDLWNMIIVQPMINSVILLYSYLFLNFGLAIIAFTILVRILLIPLTIKQSRSMKMMSSLQPKLKELQERLKNDRQKLSQETLRIYRDNGVNPIGCLGPLFIQFPIWIGLFWAINRTVPARPEDLVELSKFLYPWLPRVSEVIPLNSSFLWIKDLALPDPGPLGVPLLPILVGVSMFLMQKMTVMPSVDPRQASTNRMMLWMMPILFGFFTLQFSSGLAIYWVVSNIVGMIIQGFVTGWSPITDMLKLGGSGKESEAASKEQPAPALVTSTEEATTNEDNRNNGKNVRRSNRNRPKGARRRSRTGRNRRR
ncbi:MAG: membrane protein insertase YidC [Chloroflexi bacterium]|nr:membrane protein insertase YidC [Chloroflexota bacterium]